MVNKALIQSVSLHSAPNCGSDLRLDAPEEQGANEQDQASATNQHREIERQSIVAHAVEEVAHGVDTISQRIGVNDPEHHLRKAFERKQRARQEEEIVRVQRHVAGARESEARSAIEGAPHQIDVVRPARNIEQEGDGFSRRDRPGPRQGVVPEDEISRLITTSPSPQVACQLLIDAANDSGGPDNISAILIRLPV